jgi:cytoskeletal protein CcmA (bactofilin family)
MWWQKRYQSRVPEWVFKSTPPATNSIPSTIPQIENTQLEDAKKMPTESTALNQSRLGPSVVLKGDLEGKDDLVIEGQFEGTINLQDRCLTVGANGQVKAGIQASRVIIHGAVTGNICARERIEIRKTGRVMGDLVGPGIAIEEGAYFKGSIEILREGGEQGVVSPSSLRTEQASA